MGYHMDTGIPVGAQRGRDILAGYLEFQGLFFTKTHLPVYYFEYNLYQSVQAFGNLKWTYVDFVLKPTSLF